jgi:hypothetical protein
VAAVSDRAAVAEPSADADALRALDEEIARLPDHLRAAVVLCELDGLSRKDAAARLGVPEGTLSSRLAKARKQLAGRLRGRGLAAVGLAVLFERSASAAGVPVALADAAAELAGSGPVSAVVAELSHGVFRTLLLKKLKLASACLLLLAVGTVGLWSPIGGAAPGPVVEPSTAAARRAPVPRLVPREGIILVTSHPLVEPSVLLKPDGQVVREFKPPPGTWPVRGSLSPDGTRVALLAYRMGNDGSLRAGARPDLYVLTLGFGESPGKPLVEGLLTLAVIWSPDGTLLYWSQTDPKAAELPAADDQPNPFQNWMVELKTGKKSPLNLPAGHRLADISLDGKTLLTTARSPRGESTARTYLVPRNTLKPELVTDKPFSGMRISPDGTRVVGGRFRHQGDGTAQTELVIVDLTDRSETPVKPPDQSKGAITARWSPDGKKILYHWREDLSRHPRPAGVPPVDWVADRLSVADPDGSNPKVILRRDHREPINSVDWR